MIDFEGVPTFIVMGQSDPESKMFPALGKGNLFTASILILPVIVPFLSALKGYPLQNKYSFLTDFSGLRVDLNKGFWNHKDCIACM